MSHCITGAIAVYFARCYVGAVGLPNAIARVKDDFDSLGKLMGGGETEG